VVLLGAMDGDTVALLMGRVELDRENVRGAAGRDGWERLRWWWGARSGIGTRCVVLLGGMNGNTVALVVGSAGRDRNTVRGAA